MVKMGTCGLEQRSTGTHTVSGPSPPTWPAGISQSRRWEAWMCPWLFTIFTKKQTFKEYLHTQETHTALSQVVCPRPSNNNLASFYLSPPSEKKQVSQQPAVAEHSSCYLFLLTPPPLRELCFSVCVNFHLDGKHGPFAKVHFGK